MAPNAFATNIIVHNFLLGIGLCFLGKQEAAEAMAAALEVLSEPFQSMAKTLVDICAYAGTGNVLKIQNLLHICR